MKKLKIVSISSELDPFVKTGGLGDVARALPKSLHRLGHEVIVIIPLYTKVINIKKHNLKEIYPDVLINIDKKNSIKVSFWCGELMPGLPVYLVRNDKYFSRRKNLYGSDHENARFYLFDVAVLKLISLLKFKADIIHCHDWQAGLIPYLKRTRFKNSQTLSGAAVVYTIHNLVFQLGTNWWEVPLKYKDQGHSTLPDFSDRKIEYINFAKRAILNADVINTVSETYAQEILKRSFGQDLHRILINRQHKLFGIVNGIDYYNFNPKNDKSIYRNYDYKKLQRKKLNKKYIQKLFNLKIDQEIPVLCTTSRISYQKGFSLILEVLNKLLVFDIQMIIAGAGDNNFIKELKKIAKKFPDKLAIIPSHEDTLKYETQLYAGSDMILLPSHYEPCGINQMKAFRYGCVPIVRSTGGLSDTVIDYQPGNLGNGFKFANYNSQELLMAVPERWK